MTITEQFKAKRCVFSIECFPPKQTTQMDKLKDTDEVSYVRFASVYRQFKDINTFMDELAKLLGEKNN